jgi:carbonic anhydrase
MEIVRERHGIAGDEPLDTKYLNEAIEENVQQQVQHLRTHPVVAAKLATGKIEIHGWVYDIKSGNIRCCGRDSVQFKDFDEYYADIVARVTDD